MKKLNNNIFIKKSKNLYSAEFLIEPLDFGFGITLGNMLRRILLSNLSNLCITNVSINNLKHEFGLVQGCHEDVLEILQNVKGIIIKNSYSTFYNKKRIIEFRANLYAKGPVVLTAGMINLPKSVIFVLNPNHYICTICDDSEIFFNFIIKNKNTQIIYNSNLNNMLTLEDTNPIKNVNFKVYLIVDSLGNIKESLQLNIETNGTITSLRSLQEAFKLLLKTLYPFLKGNILLKTNIL